MGHAGAQGVSSSLSSWLWTYWVPELPLVSLYFSRQLHGKKPSLANPSALTTAHWTLLSPLQHSFVVQLRHPNSMSQYYDQRHIIFIPILVTPTETEPLVCT